MPGKIQIVQEFPSFWTAGKTVGKIATPPWYSLAYSLLYSPQGISYGISYELWGKLLDNGYIMVVLLFSPQPRDQKKSYIPHNGENRSNVILKRKPKTFLCRWEGFTGKVANKNEAKKHYDSWGNE